MESTESSAAQLPRMSYLERLESEAIHIPCETVATHRPLKLRADNNGGSPEPKKREGNF